MPQMGESIAEGTIVRWIKKVGEAVDRDEPLFEISTDKVDAEIPSPAAGVLLDIKVNAGETVPVNSVVATIGASGEAAASGPNVTAGAAGAVAATSSQADGQAASRPAPPATAPYGGTESGATAPPRTVAAERSASAPAPAPAPRPGDATDQGVDERRRQRSSPLVRRIAQEHHVDIGQINGTGIGGRVTKHDILAFIEQGPSAAVSAPVAAYAPGERVEVVPMSVMRKKIAEHMILSRRTSAHVHSVFEVNYARIEAIREAKRADYERQGAKLTYMAFIAKAIVDALRRHKLVNASIDGDTIVYKKDVNLGIAVALEDAGLIVPVVKGADNLNVLGLARAVQDVATRARSKKLNPEEVRGGTFTITNPGNFGALFGLPIINQPQVAILGVGTVEKRPVVIDDMIAIRPMGYLTLGYDHRLVDGATADRFMADVKKMLENFDPNQV